MQRKTTQAVAFAAGILVTLIAGGLNGCAKVNTANDPAFVSAADDFVNVTVGPEYETYIMQDPKFGEVGVVTPSRGDRLTNLETFRAAVLEAKTELEETTTP